MGKYGRYGRLKRHVLSENFKNWIKENWYGTPWYYDILDFAELTGSNLTKKNKSAVRAYAKSIIPGPSRKRKK